MTEWLEGDAIGTRAVASVEVTPRALVLRSEGLSSEVPFDSVLGIVQDGASAILLAPRRRPSPPWFVIPGTALGETVEAFVDLVDRRSREGHYRAAPARRSERSKDDLRSDVLARRPVPGEVDVPVGLGPGGRVRRRLGLGAAIATFALGSALAIAVPILGAPLATIGAGATAVSVGRMLHARRRRVLVLAPEGAVVGFPERVATIGWDEVGPIAVEPAERGRALAFRSRDAQPIGFLHESWIAAPIDRVAAIAEHYRRRYTR
jgi:hypothetical protein